MASAIWITETITKISGMEVRVNSTNAFPRVPFRTLFIFYDPLMGNSTVRVMDRLPLIIPGKLITFVGL